MNMDRFSQYRDQCLDSKPEKPWPEPRNQDEPRKNLQGQFEAWKAKNRELIEWAWATHLAALTEKRERLDDFTLELWYQHRMRERNK